MKKTLVALLCSLPLAAQAFLTANTDTDIDYYHDFSLSVDQFKLSHNQYGDWGLNETRIGWAGLSAITSDSLDFGVSYETMFSAGVENREFQVKSGMHLHDDIIFSLDTSFFVAGMKVLPSVDWNISTSAMDAELAFGYQLSNVDASTTLFYDLSSIGYSGSEFALGYNFRINDAISVKPNMVIPFDSDWEQNTIRAGLSVNVAFDTNPAQ